MMATEAERPTVEERYATASVTSDLTYEPNPERHNALDVVIAAGLERNHRLGHALIHMRAEWDRCDKPAKRTEVEIAARAAQIPDKKGRPDMKRARAEALVWHSQAMREKAKALSGRSVVVGLLTDWALARGVDVDLLSPAIFHFLAPTCPVCGGLGKLRRQDAPVLGANCYHCRGEGTWPRPLGAQAIHEYLKRCLNSAAGGLAGRMRG